MNKIVISTLLLLIGCSSTPQYTPIPWTSVYQIGELSLHMQTTFPIEEANHTQRNIWRYQLINNTNKDKCVKIDWRILDASDQTKHGWVFSPSHSIIHMGFIVQTGWIDNNQFVPIPPIGILEKFTVKRPINNKCTN